MFYWIYDHPSWQIGLLFAAFFVGVTWLGILFIRPFLRLFVRNQDGLNDLVGYVLGCYSVFYGLLVGLIAVAAYQSLAEVEKTVALESGNLTVLYRMVSNYPEPLRGQLQRELQDYTLFVIKDDWAAQRQGKLLAEGTNRLKDFQDHMLAFEPATKAQEILHAQALREFSDYIKIRRLRRHSVDAGIPTVMWGVVIIGAFINIMIVWMFEMRIIVQFILGGLLALFIGIVVFLIAAMDNPFRGELSVSPAPFQAVYDLLMKPGKAAPLELGGDSPVGGAR